MEKITIRSAYTEVSLYARWSATAAGKPKPTDAPIPARADDGAAAGMPPSPEKGVTARSPDGDTFTLSIEARAIQVTETVSIGTERSEGMAAGAPEASRAGRLEALLAALDRKPGEGHRRHRYPGLTDAADVAARAAEDWDREFAGRQVSRGEFAAGIRAGLDCWAARPDTRSRSTEFRVFRSEVAVEIRARLDRWAADAEPESQDINGPGSG